MSEAAARHVFVVPAYGQSPYLAQCLASLQAQRRPSPIVVSSSTPHAGLMELAERHGARLVTHAENRGIGHDWNAALAAVDAEWVTLAHQDDVYLPGFAADTLAAIDQHPACQLVCTGYAEQVDERVRTLTPLLLIKRLLLELGFLGRAAIDSPAARQRVLRFGCPIACPSVTLRHPGRSPFFREDLRLNLDWDAWLRLSRQAGAFVYLRQTLMLHRIHRGSETSGGIRGGARAREDRLMFEQLWPPAIAGLLARAYALSYDTGPAT